eukprot:COSAG01_NODE_23821_length_800_cov_2.349501_1_plen_206_part_00
MYMDETGKIEKFPYMRRFKRLLLNRRTRAALVTLMFHKGQGKDKEDPGSYRPVTCLLHIYKFFSTLVLHRLAGEVELFHVDTQGGFRQGRSTEDMITLVKLWQEMAGEQGRELLIYFSDFKSAFTSVSHKAINKALAEAGASDKTRALIRVIYDMAELQVKVQGRDGDSATSEAFPVDRGSPQGDGLSPMVTPPPLLAPPVQLAA